MCFLSTIFPNAPAHSPPLYFLTSPLQNFLGTQDTFSDPISIRTPWESCSQPTATTCLWWSWRLKQCFALASLVKGPLKTPLSVQRSDHYAMLMGSSMGKTAVHGYHHVVVAERLQDYLESNELNIEPLQSAYKRFLAAKPPSFAFTTTFCLKLIVVTVLCSCCLTCLLL